MLAVGVFEAGYGFGEELPIFLLIFAIPAVPAIAVRLYAAHKLRRRESTMSSTEPVTDPAVRALIDAINAGDRGALLPMSGRPRTR